MLAVTVCDPTASDGTVSVPPVPRAPAMLDVQRMEAVRSPSSASVAVALRRTGFPVRSAVPSVGGRSVTTGIAFAGRTVTVRVAVALSPPVSVTEAVMTCVPTDKLAGVIRAPEPSGPSTLELHWTCADRSPSVVSDAVAVKTTPAFWKNVVPTAGAVIATAGGVGVTVNGTLAELVAPSESETVAVRVCGPSASGRVRVAPVPSAPPREDVH